MCGQFELVPGLESAVLMVLLGTVFEMTTSAVLFLAVGRRAASWLPVNEAASSANDFSDQCVGLAWVHDRCSHSIAVRGLTLLSDLPKKDRRGRPIF